VLKSRPGLPGRLSFRKKRPGTFCRSVPATLLASDPALCLIVVSLIALDDEKAGFAAGKRFALDGGYD
jgi:hypothetical protein